MSGSTQTSTSTAEPYGPLKPLLNTAIKGGMRAFKGGYGANRGSNVVPMSEYTKDANNNLINIANDNSGTNGLQGQYQGIIDNGGFNDAMKSALDQFRQTSTSEYNPNANPGFQGVLDATLRDASGAVNRTAASAGRFGGAVHQGQLGRTTGDISNAMRSADFNTFLGRKDNATQAMGNLGQAGIGNLSAAYQGLQMPEQTRMGVGAQYEDLFKRQIDDRNRIQNLPWEQLSKLLAVGSGTGSYNSTTTQSPGPNSFLQALGMGATGANLLFGGGAMSGGLAGLF